MLPPGCRTVGCPRKCVTVRVRHTLEKSEPETTHSLLLGKRESGVILPAGSASLQCISTEEVADSKGKRALQTTSVRGIGGWRWLLCGARWPELTQRGSDWVSLR